MSRILNRLWIVILCCFAVTMFVMWLCLPAPIQTMFTATSGYICNPSIDALRRQYRLRGCCPGATSPKDFVLDLPEPPFAPVQGDGDLHHPCPVMPLDLPAQPFAPVQGVE